jgi:hypothetical protein
VAEALPPAFDASDSASKERRRRRPRWRKWVILALVLLALRFSLSLGAAAFLAARLSHAFGTEVEIGRVSLQPLDAIFTLRDVTVHAPAGQGSPPIVADRVRIDVQWLPLIHRTLRVRELGLESARVDLDRLPDGGFTLSNLEPPNASAELAEGWSFALDRVALRSSRLRVRDLGPGGGVFEATLDDAAVSGIQRQATVFGKSKNIRVDALVAGGQLRVRGHYELRDDGVLLDATLRLKDLPLEQAGSYVARFGWTGLAGRVSGNLHWQREPRRRDLLSGRIVVRRGNVQVAGLSEPALAARRTVVDVTAIDLLNRRISIGSLSLHGATIALRADAGAPIPLIATGPARQHAARPAASSWNWMIERFDADDARLRFLAADEPYDLRARASGENLGPGAYWSPLRVEVTRRDTAAAFDGTVRLSDGVTIEGRLLAAGVDFPRLARGTALPWADLVQSGEAKADLTIQLDTASDDATPLYARGAITLTDLFLTAPEPCTFAFGSTAIDLTLEGFTLREPPRADGRSGHPTRIRFSSANVSGPSLLLTRTADGWILPPFVSAVEAPAGEPAEIVVTDVKGDAGSLVVVDQVPTPSITWQVNAISGKAQQLSLPAFSFEGLESQGSDRTFGQLELAGSRRDGTSTFEASGEGVPLAATSPYLRVAGLPYGFEAGRGSFIARGTIEPTTWRADASLKLQSPVLGGSAASLEQAIGMTIPTALMRLQDPGGDVNLQMVLTPPPANGTDAYNGQIAAGVRDTIRTIVEASRRAAPDFPAVSVLFAPGQAEPTESSMRELRPIADLLRSSAGLVVELSADTSYADRRWLAEQALRLELENSGGFRKVLRVLGVPDGRARVRAALAERAEGEPGLLDSDDEALLAKLLAESPPVDEAQLGKLRAARVAGIAKHLTDEYGVGGKRVIARDVMAGDGARLAAVRVQLRIVPDADPPRSHPPPAVSAPRPTGPAAIPRLD